MACVFKRRTIAQCQKDGNTWNIMTLSYKTPRVLETAIAKGAEKPKKQQMYVPGTNCPIKPQVPLAHLTSLRVGGPAEWYVAPRTLIELKASWGWAIEQGLAVTVVGAGSNLLASDRGLPGLTICTRYLRYAEFHPSSGRVKTAAGQSLVRLAWKAAELGCEGMEWAVGIPGTVGGAVVMNAGAHGSCTAEILVEAQVISPLGVVETLSPEDLGYGYRTSILQGSDIWVVEATFQLRPGANPAKLKAMTEAQLEHRRSTQPYHLPSCGSVFRNPGGDRGAGWLIEQTGLKGYQIGGARVADLHANFIVNCGGATAEDIFRLIHYVRDKVQNRWSVTLEPEVRILGEFPDL